MRIHQQGGVAGDFAQGGTVGGEDGELAGEGLDDGEAERLVERWEDEGIGGAVDGGEIGRGDVVEQLDERGVGEGFEAAVESGIAAVGARDGDERDGPVPARGEEFEGVEDAAEIFAGVDGAHEEQEARREAVARAGGLLRGGGGGAEGVADAVIDDVHTLRGDARERFVDLLFGELGDGDDAARGMEGVGVHAAVVAAREPAGDRAGGREERRVLHQAEVVDGGEDGARQDERAGVGRGVEEIGLFARDDGGHVEMAARVVKATVQAVLAQIRRVTELQGFRVANGVRRDRIELVLRGQGRQVQQQLAHVASDAVGRKACIDSDFHGRLSFQRDSTSRSTRSGAMRWRQGNPPGMQ